MVGVEDQPKVDAGHRAFVVRNHRHAQSGPVSQRGRLSTFDPPMMSRLYGNINVNIMAPVDVSKWSTDVQRFAPIINVPFLA